MLWTTRSGNSKMETARPARVGAEGSTPGALGMMRRLRLLVVDEDAAALSAIGKRLSHMGYDATLAENGFTAVSMLLAQQFDLILVDMGMRMLSGTETIRKMLASGLLSGAPVMAISGASSNVGAVESLGAGADDHIVKPFDFDTLDVRMRHSIARARQMAELERYNETLDARIARRAVELGEVKAELEETQVERQRLLTSLQHLQDEVERLRMEH
ncbi:response regulator transcription factor [Sphingobium subterraneum]|uniref:DNA-binding response OmpR family regulator n=1 Tax=Sphingobium subterraneum TaxID=627688 RepID=A0A841IZ99_9SPHN|nr:response regulator [Sphingobium subterraneum]MBB6124289.1 DNA-binding response OmpR family regulator [Sphingobium subterraneum]